MFSQSKIWKKMLSAGLSFSLCFYALPVWAIYRVPVNVAKPSVGASMGSVGAGANVVAITRIQTQVPGALPVSLNGSLVGVNSPSAPLASLEGRVLADAGAGSAGLLTTPVAVAKHPVLGIINDLQKAGVPIQSMPKTSEEFAALEEAIKSNVPAGRAKQNLLAFAQSLSVGGNAGVSRMAAVFDGNGMRDGKYVMPVSEAAKPGGFWNWMSQRKSGWFGLRKYAEEKAEEGRTKAGLIDKEALKVPVENLRWVPDAKELPGKLSEMEGGPSGIVGQDRALESIRFGLEMEDLGYNLIVTGEDGTGRETAIRQELAKIAPTKETPSDLVAATNFKDPSKPVILSLNAGSGAAFKGAVRQMTGQLEQTLPQQLNSGPIAEQKEKMHEAFEKGQAETMEKFHAEVAKVREGRYGIQFIQQEEGQFVVAVTVGGKLLSPEKVDELIAKEAADDSVSDKVTQEGLTAAQKAMSPQIKQIGKQLQKIMGALASARGQVHQQMAQMDAQAAQEVVSQLAQGLIEFARDEAHQAFAQRAMERQSAIDKKVSEAVILGKFGLTVSIDQGKLMASPTWTDPAMAEQSKALGPLAALLGGGAQDIGPEEFAQLQEAGQIPADLTWEALSKAVVAKAKEFLPKYQAMGEANRKDSDALPAPSENSRKIMGYIKMLVTHMAQNYQIFLPQEKPENPMMAMLMSQEQIKPEKLYKISVLTSNDPGQGAPVIFEKTPTYQKIFGNAEGANQLAQKGGMMVKYESPGGPDLQAGSFIKANGGYLVLDLMDVLREPGVYQSLMQMVRNGKAVINEGGLMGFYQNQGDHYEVPAEVKIVFIGSPYLKMMLSQYDEDFGRLFGAVAEFERSLDIGAEAMTGYLKFMRAMVEQSGGKISDFTRGAVSVFFETAARMAESNQKLTAQFGVMRKLMMEATYWAQKAGRDVVERQDVEKAVSERVERRGGMRRRIKEMFTSDIFHVAIEGMVVGQINGLAVVGDFGVPTRITFENYVRPNGEFVVSADQRAALTGTSFDKSIANIKGFMGRTFGRNRTIPIEVSISFEQMNGGIDGDSATQTMIYGTLSTLTGLPIDQGIAVTGSADQKGNVQVIGGVNHKIEGYFDVVKEKLAKEGRVMEGGQGIIIPAGNVADLALRADIIEAVKAGKFHIYAVDHVSQGVEILMKTPYSEVLKKVNGRVDEVRIAAMKAAAEMEKKK